MYFCVNDDFVKSYFFVEFEEKFIDKFWYMDCEIMKLCNVMEVLCI